MHQSTFTWVHCQHLTLALCFSALKEVRCFLYFQISRFVVPKLFLSVPCFSPSNYSYSTFYLNFLIMQSFGVSVTFLFIVPPWIISDNWQLNCKLNNSDGTQSRRSRVRFFVDFCWKDTNLLSSFMLLNCMLIHFIPTWLFVSKQLDQRWPFRRQAKAFSSYQVNSW